MTVYDPSFIVKTAELERFRRVVGGEHYPAQRSRLPLKGLPTSNLSSAIDKNKGHHGQNTRQMPAITEADRMSPR